MKTENKIQVEEPDTEFERWMDDGQIDEQELIIEIDMFYGRQGVTKYVLGDFNRKEDGSIDFLEEPDTN